MPVRVFVSYAHDNEDHKAHVLRFCALLREHGIDARVDRYDTHTRRDWYAWMTEQINEADYVLAVASPRFKGAADGNAPARRNPGVQSEAALLRDLIHSDRPTWTEKLLPIVLPGSTIAEIPQFLQPYCADHYVISELSLAGIEHLLRTITRQPSHPMPPLGDPPVLPPASLTPEPEPEPEPEAPEPEPEIDAEGIARRFSRMDPEEASAELTGLTPKGAAQVLDELMDLGDDLAAELLDATAPAFAAQALYELADQRGNYLPSKLLTLMRPEPAALLLVTIREGDAPVDPELATSLLLGDDVPIPDSVDPDKAAALLLGVLAESPHGVPRVLRVMKPASIVTMLARMTREQAADVLTGGDGHRDEEVNAAVLLAMPPELRAEVLELMGPDAAAEALMELDTTDTAEILRTLPESRANRLFRRFSEHYATQMRVDEVRQGKSGTTVLTGLSASDASDVLEALDTETAIAMLEETDIGRAAAILAERLGQYASLGQEILPAMPAEWVARLVIAVHENRTDLDPGDAMIFLCVLYGEDAGSVMDVIDVDQAATILVSMSLREELVTTDRGTLVAWEHPAEHAPNLLDAMTPSRAAEVLRRMGAEQAASVLNRGYQEQVPGIAKRLFAHVEQAEVDKIVGFMTPKLAKRLREQ